LIADNVVNSGTGSGSFNWTVPNIATAGAKVKVSWPAGTPGTIEAQSATFAILAPSFAFGAPLAGASWKIGDNRDIKWSYPINPFHVLIEIRRDESDTWTRILDRDQFTRTNGTFVYTWTVTGPPASNKAQIRITDVDRGISGVSPKFTIK
jgi:hypothetical protein